MVLFLDDCIARAESLRVYLRLFPFPLFGFPAYTYTNTYVSVTLEVIHQL